jgi:hypothetical protein
VLEKELGYSYKGPVNNKIRADILVVLAHYCVIVHHSQKWWCMKGWSEKVFDAVVRTLHEDWQPNLDWAVQGMRSPNLFIKVCLIE